MLITFPLGIKKCTSFRSIPLIGVVIVLFYCFDKLVIPPHRMVWACEQSTMDYGFGVRVNISKIHRYQCSVKWSVMKVILSTLPLSVSRDSKRFICQFSVTLRFSINLFEPSPIHHTGSFRIFSYFTLWISWLTSFAWWLPTPTAHSRFAFSIDNLIECRNKSFT